MSTLYLILALVIAIIAVIFALQNTAAVTISFFAWEVGGSLSLVVLVTLVIGVLVGWLFVAPSLVKNSLQGSGQRKRITELEKEVEKFKTSVETLQGKVKELEAERAVRQAPAPTPSLAGTQEKLPD